MPCEELDIVWNNIKAEARALADCEPMLASFYHATLLKHENLGSALSYMLANKLASPIMPAIAIREVVEEAYAAEQQADGTVAHAHPGKIALSIGNQNAMDAPQGDLHQGIEPGRSFHCVASCVKYQAVSRSTTSP